MEHIIDQISYLSEKRIGHNNENNQNVIIKKFNNTIDLVCEQNDVTEDIVFNTKITLPRCKWFENDKNFYGYTNHVVIVINKNTYKFVCVMSHYDNVKDFTNCNLYNVATLSKDNKININKTLTVLKNKELLLRKITNNIDGCKYNNYNMKMFFKN